MIRRADRDAVVTLPLLGRSRMFERMVDARVNGRCSSGGLLAFALGALVGCQSSRMDADASTRDAGASSACRAGEWCSEIPQPFAVARGLLGDQLIVQRSRAGGSSLLVGRGDPWTTIACPASAGSEPTLPHDVLSSNTADTAIRCPRGWLRWRRGQTSALPLPAGVIPNIDVSVSAFATGASLFFVARSSIGVPSLYRCDERECEQREMPSSRAHDWTLYAASAEDVELSTSDAAWHRTASGWEVAATSSAHRSPVWPPSDEATCLLGNAWVRCDSDPGAIGPFAPVQRTPQRLLLGAKFDEFVEWDGATAVALQSLSWGAFQRARWPALAAPRGVELRWLAASAVDGVVTDGHERVFFGLVAQEVGEGTSAPTARSMRVFTRLDDGAWQSLGGDEVGACTTVSATAVDNLWASGARAGVFRFNGLTWQSAGISQPIDLCAMNDGSAFVIDGQTRTASRVRIGASPESPHSAARMIACTHSDVWVVGEDDSVAHWFGDRWVEIAPPPVPAQFRTIAATDVGLVASDQRTHGSFRWSGAAWEPINGDAPPPIAPHSYVRLQRFEWATDGYALYSRAAQ